MMFASRSRLYGILNSHLFCKHGSEHVSLPVISRFMLDKRPFSVGLTERQIQYRPRRIILIRHAQSRYAIYCTRTIYSTLLLLSHVYRMSLHSSCLPLFRLNRLCSHSHTLIVPKLQWKCR